MLKNGAEAQELEDLLAAGEKDTRKLSATFKLVLGTCKECHRAYRD